jgi:hypothetical protein
MHILQPLMSAVGEGFHEPTGMSYFPNRLNPFARPSQSPIPAELSLREPAAPLPTPKPKASLQAPQPIMIHEPVQAQPNIHRSARLEPKPKPKPKQKNRTWRNGYGMFGGGDDDV